MAVYEAALKGEAQPIDIGASRTKPGTVNDAVVRYLRSAAFTGKATTTQAERRATLERFRREHADKRIRMLQAQHISPILGKLRPFPQRNMLHALRALMAFAKIENLVVIDPTASYKLARRKDGIAPGRRG